MVTAPLQRFTPWRWFPSIELRRSPYPEQLPTLDTSADTVATSTSRRRSLTFAPARRRTSSPRSATRRLTDSPMDSRVDHPGVPSLSSSPSKLPPPDRPAQPRSWAACRAGTSLGVRNALPPTLLLASTPTLSRECFGQGVAAPRSCSALVVSHHLDGLLRLQAPGLLHPGSGKGSPDFVRACAPECLATLRQRLSLPVRIRGFPPTLLPLEDHSPITASTMSPCSCSLLRFSLSALHVLRE